MDFKIPIVRYPSLYDIDSLRQEEVTWDGLVAEFSQHLRVETKEKAPGFGPYVLRPTPTPCLRHKGGPRSAVHRCDDCVAGLTLAVFDVDIGSQEAVNGSDSRLNDAGVARLWYSSYSFHKGSQRPSLRLVLPLSETVPPEKWESFRKGVISRFSIPADVRKCSGLSHFYFVPSCPPTAEPIFDYSPGSPLEVKSIPTYAPAASRATVLEALKNWAVPAEPTAPVEIQPLVDLLKKKVASYAHSTDLEVQRKGALLKLLLEGKPLAEHGGRNEATRDVAGVVVWALPPETPVSVIMHLMRPSVNAMIAAGSKLTYSKVEHMIIRSMRNFAEHREFEKQIEERWTQAAQAARSSIPTYPKEE